MFLDRSGDMTTLPPRDTSQYLEVMLDLMWSCSVCAHVCVTAALILTYFSPLCRPGHAQMLLFSLLQHFYPNIRGKEDPHSHREPFSALVTHHTGANYMVSSSQLYTSGLTRQQTEKSLSNDRTLPGR